MTAKLSINVNRIALLRNSRSNVLPSLRDAIVHCANGGAEGITVHPRPDERHIRAADVSEIAELIASDCPDLEYNIEGYPDKRLFDLVRLTKPTQCTLVPDAPDQATSDHGWDVSSNRQLLSSSIDALHEMGIRVSLFMDADADLMPAVSALGADRIELYTEQYAVDWGTSNEQATWKKFIDAAGSAADCGLGINAGHDLNLRNLPQFSSLPGLLECSIGHAVACDAVFVGLQESVRRYRRAIAGEVVECDWYPKDYRVR